ncbi:MAG: HlyD family efflux transporter periplasmic adaptor subunit [Chthoniobacterales bacterium]
MTTLSAQRKHATAKIEAAFERFDRAVFLRQPAFWSRAIIWTIVGFTVLCLLWVTFAQIEEVVVAAGKLEPTGAVRDVQAPVAGVVEKVYVQENQQVRKGDPLVRLDQQITSAQIGSQRSVAASLHNEIEFYARQMADVAEVSSTDSSGQELPPEMLALARDRANLVAENRLFRAELAHSTEGIDLPVDRKAAFENAEEDRTARAGALALATSQAESQLEGARNQHAQTEKLLENNRKILASYTKLAQQDAVSEVERLARETEVIRAENEEQKMRTNVASLELEIRKNREQRDATETEYKKEAFAGLQRNQQRIAEIDSRLSKAIVDDKQRLSQIESQLTQLNASLGYQELVAPVDGVVFDLRARQPGGVVAASDLLLKLVPSENLIAKAFLANKDVGFAREGMKARVRIDSFPFREFGDIGGTVSSIGSDALAPTQVTPYYSFPARIELDDQHLIVRGQRVKLQSGMAVTVNMQVRKRSVLSLVIDLLLRPAEKLREVR